MRYTTNIEIKIVCHVVLDASIESKFLHLGHFIAVIMILSLQNEWRDHCVYWHDVYHLL